MNKAALIKRIYVVLKSSWLRTLFKGKILSFASFEIASNLNTSVGKLNTILDVGANNGQFQKAANYIFPEAKIYSFEPIPELFQKLKKNNHKNIINFNVALGNQTSTLLFNQNTYSHSSSFLELDKRNDDFPSKDVKKIEVQVDTLDNISKNLEIKSPALLKLDVQGFELAALKGAQSTLSSEIDYVIIEVGFENLYENQPTFTELNSFLNSMNFELKCPLDFNFGKNKNYIESDLLYCKKN